MAWRDHQVTGREPKHCWRWGRKARKQGGLGRPKQGGGERPDPIARRALQAEGRTLDSFLPPFPPPSHTPIPNSKTFLSG